MSESSTVQPMPVHEAIARAKAECSPVGKDGWNDQQRFKFRGVDAVVNGAARALNRYGVVIIPTVKLKKIEKRTYQSKSGSTMMHVLVPVLYRLYGADGSGPVEVEIVGEASDAGDKVISKATSVAYRIMLLQVLNLPTGDPDPDSETHERDGNAAAGGDPWGNAKPAKPKQASNGTGGQVSRPAQRPQPAQAKDAEPDPDAQPFFDEAHQARTVKALEDVHRRAREAGKLAAFGRNPGTGGIGGFGAYANWRKKQLEDESAALAELQQAAGDMDPLDLDAHVKKVTGTDLEGASATQLREAAGALKASAAA